MINHISYKENAETLDRMRTERKKGHILRKLTSHAIKNDWIKSKKDLEMSSCKHTKEEISIIEGIVYRGDKIIIPNSLKKEDSKNRTLLRRSRKNKDQKLLRGRYWFPKMNNVIDRIIDQCYKYKVVSSYPRPEPIKPTFYPIEDRRQLT